MVIEIVIEIYLRHYAGFKETRELSVHFCEHFRLWIKQDWKASIEKLHLRL
jgi:hypothetical protein